MQASSRSSSMERTSQWVSSQDVPTDLVVRVAGAAFPLHKAVMVPKCGYIRKAVAMATRPDPASTVEIELDGLPGGADAFEKAARYCYGANFEISARNAAALLCAAAFLDMQPADGGLARRVEEFLAQAGLRTLPNAIAVLRSCEGLLLTATEELGVARRAADAVALRVCNEVLFPTRSPPEWWASELAALSPASFHRVFTALRCRRAGPEVLVAAATAYAELLLADGKASDHRALLESVVAMLPSADDAPLPAAFLCRLLHDAVTTEASARMQAKADAALARENEALRSELARMRAHMSSGVQQSKGSGSRTAATATVAGKKASFFGSMSRTLSRLNPFRAGGGWSKDTSSIRDSRGGAMNVVKPRRRRSSIS
ncbi:unnamed protein product [Triticum turgidum subsp. durum]|uniref:BTB domain-containing protein n=1 Tax=Triticum turgidum subsp. durum TaxID=4567 RepID=A0A9R0WAY1_TRITD|nr:unnamed protein product [Triticum turgidum subsp. durum]